MTQFPGTWMTTSESMVYRVVPKCACSTIGQIMYYSDHGHFFDGDIHDAQTGLHKWALSDSKEPIARNVMQHQSYTFTCVRNPYQRILSSFFDKICGIQRNGGYYRGNLVPFLIEDYGVSVGDPADGFAFDQIKSFRRFLLFARDTIRWRKPMPPDIHWSPMASHIATLIANGGRYDQIFRLEQFDAGMQNILTRIDSRYIVDLKTMPRFNESAHHGPERAHPVADYFDDLSLHLVYEMYKRDFTLFKYDSADPANTLPTGEIDLDEVHAKLC